MGDYGDGATNFEEIKVVKFQWLLRGFCCDLPSLKIAAKYQAIQGIILSLLILLLGAGGNFLLAGLHPTNIGPKPEAIAMYGVIFLAIATLLLVFNLVLLSRVRDNHCQAVVLFQI